VKADLHRVLLEADRTEEELLRQLTGHPVWTDISSLPIESLVTLLLQRRFVSMTFTPVYDLGIDALNSPAAIALAREIVREEYPRGKPSHREDLVSDLVAIGVSREQILASRPTPETTAVVVETLALMGEAASAANDVPVLTMLRFWGEVVVATEYGELWKGLAPYFASPARPSRFYYEHYQHDGIEALATASSATHSGRLGVCLRGMLDGPRAITAFTHIETRILRTRMRFYDQFSVA
jgi:hypothetical protein